MAQDINNFIDPKLIESINKINTALVTTGTTIDTVLLPAIKKLEEAQKKLGKGTDDNKSKRKKLTESEKEAARIVKQLEAAEIKLLSLQKGQQDALIKTRTELQKNTKAVKDLQRAQAAQKGSTEQLTAVNIILEKRLRNVNQATEKGARSAKLLTSAIDRNNKKITAQGSAMSKQKRNIGNYSSALKGVAMQFAGALGLTSLVFLFINVLKGSFNTIREFTKQNAVLAGVLGKTRKEITELTDQAINLGSVYPVTASEVNKLQVSFARLGFTQAEIINLTEATIQGSIALNSSLDETATLVGAVVKAYQSLGTTDAGEIIDKLTLSTQLSSLSFSGLETALPKVASAASAMNIDLSTTLTHLGLINDATLDASISGTSLRNIYLELAKRGITLNEALELINNSSNKLATSFELFGKRGAIAGLALANAGDRAIEFKDAVDDAGGTAERVAKEQMATLDGSIKGLSSSWEKFILGFKESEGFFRAVIDSLSLAIDTFSNDSISSLRKLVEFMSLGFIPAASKIQKRLDTVAKNIANASVKDLEFTIKVNGEKLKNGSKTDKLILEMLKNRLQQQKIIDIAAERDAKIRKEKAENDAEVATFARAQEASVKRIKIEEEESKARVQAIIDRIDFEADFKKRQAEEIATIDEEILDNTIEINTEAIDEHKRLLDEQRILDEEYEASEIEAAERKKVRNEEIRQQAFALGNAIFDFRLSKLDAELEAAEGNEQKQAEIRIKIAKAEKQQALFNIAINTATGIVKALPNLLLAAIVGSIGLVQAATVAARPIPQFAKGTNYAPGGVAELAERGRERVINPDGTVWMAENRGLYNLQQGSKVKTHSQTITQELKDDRIVNGLNGVKKAIQRMPQQRQESRFNSRQKGFREGYLAAKHRLN
jgi:hypothetical protein